MGACLDSFMFMRGKNEYEDLCGKNCLNGEKLGTAPYFHFFFSLSLFSENRVKIGGCP